MCNPLQFRILAVVFALCAFECGNTRAEIVLQSVNIVAGHTVSQTAYNNTSLPAFGTLVATFDEPIGSTRSSTVDYSLTQSNDVAVFDFRHQGSFQHNFFSSSLSFTSSFVTLGGIQGGAPLMSFTVDRISSYEISGSFFASLSGLFPSQESSANYSVTLLEFENGNFGPPPNVLFQHQHSDNLNGASGSFTRSTNVGQRVGLSNEILNGSLTGLLLPGNVYGYNLGFGAQAKNLSGPSFVSGSTSGNFTMTVTAVPEPRATLLLLLAATTLVHRRIRSAVRHLANAG